MSDPQPRVALTGATGFLGRHVVALLAPDHDLVCITRGGSAPDGHTGVSVDIGGDDGAATVAALTTAFSGCAVVVHAAGMVSHEAEDATALWAVHVKGTERVFDAARAAGVKRVVYLSTSGTIAVGKDPTESNEQAESPLQTISRWPYYRSKWVAEDAALANHRDGLDVICLNPGLLLGPGDDTAGASTRSVRVFLDEDLPVVPQGGPCFVDVRDAAVAVAAALTKGRGGQRYLLGGGNLSWVDFYGALARITGRPAPKLQAPAGLTRAVLASFGQQLDGDGLVSLPMSPAELELATFYWYADWSLARQDLGFQPRDPLTTLEDTVADILQRRRRGFQLYGARA